MIESPPQLRERLSSLVAERERSLAGFLEAEQDRIAGACHDMARRFARGGALVAHGAGAAATDAAHVAVEFMHPVIVGKRALPALALANDTTGASRLGALGRPDDIALALTHGASHPAADEFLLEARRRGLLTIALTGGGPKDRAAAEGRRTGAREIDYLFQVPSDDPHVVQEVQETVYHVLWELVHVFFEHPGLLEETCVSCGDVAVEARVVDLRDGVAAVGRDGAREQVAADLVEGLGVGDLVLCHAGVALEKVPEAPAPAPDEPTGFLYPFLDSAESDLEAVLSDVRTSTVRKGAEVTELRRRIEPGAVEGCGRAIRERLHRGGRLISFGNGGSSTDAQDLAADLGALGWPAIALTGDVATVTAVGNDVGFDKVFARQLIPLGRKEDVAVAISTSGSSPNVVAGLEEARRHGMLTCAIVGYDGGRLAGVDWLDHLLVVRSDYVPRLQEAHATIYHLLLAVIGERR